FTFQIILGRENRTVRGVRKEYIIPISDTAFRNGIAKQSGPKKFLFALREFLDLLGSQDKRAVQTGKKALPYIEQASYVWHAQFVQSRQAAFNACRQNAPPISLKEFAAINSSDPPSFAARPR